MMIAQIIHNPARKDRMENILKQVREQQFAYEIHEAIMDSENPVRGCHLSHRKVVQKAKDEGWPYVWVMEDDCVFTAPGAMKYFFKNIPLFYGVYTGGSYGAHKLWTTTSQYIFPKSISGAHCYLVRRAAYDMFLSMDVNEHLDVAISKTFSNSTGTGLILCNPMVAIQMPGYSDIACQEVDYNNDKYLWQHSLYDGKNGKIY